METMVIKEKRVNKYVCVKVIQQSYGYGWEDVSEYSVNDMELLKHDLIEYRLTGYSTRVISRRVLSVDYFKI